MTVSPLRLGTRGSDLALAQAKLVADLLKAGSPWLETVIVPIRTAGDVLSPAELGQRDAKSAFTGEIERELLAGNIDAAVHSMKDLPAQLDGRLTIAATPLRGDPRDALVTKGGELFTALKPGAHLGTSSIRRRAQILSRRPDLIVDELHGNVGTRVKKMVEGPLDGLVLAAAGLDRAGLGHMITERLDVAEMVPAVCQGIIAVEARVNDAEVSRALFAADHPPTHAAGSCERAFSAELGGDCNVPLGAFATTKNGSLTAVGVVASPDGKRVVRVEEQGPASDPERIGKLLAAKAEAAGGRSLLKELRS